MPLSFKYIQIKNYFKKVLFSTLIIVLLISSNLFSQYANVKTDSLLILGNEVYRNGNYAQSQIIYEQALDKYSSAKGSREWIIAAVGLGASLIDQGELLSGEAWFLAADSSLNKNISLELQAYVKSNVGWVNLSLRRYENSLTHYQKALDFAKRSGDKYRIAQVSNSLSTLSFTLGLYDDAINFAHTAVDNFIVIDDPFLLSISYSNLSSAYEALGFTEKAEQAMLKSLEISESINNEELAAVKRFYLGLFYHQTGNYQKALVYYTKYLSFVEAGGQSPFIAPMYSYIGKVYYSLGDFEKALEYYNTGYSYKKDRENLALSSSDFLQIAVTYQKLKEYDFARSFFQKALDMLESKKDVHLTIETYINLSQLELISGNEQEALATATKAQEMSASIESKQLKAKAYAALGKVHLKLNNPEQALKFSQKAYNIAAIFKGYRLADYLILLSETYYRTGSDSSFYYADLAFAEIEREQSNIYGDNLESSVFSKYADFYDEVAFWYLEKNKNLEKSFEITERGRARVLMNRLSFSDLDLQDILHDSVLISLRQKEKDIDKTYRALEVSKNDSVISDLKNQLLSQEFDYQSYTNNLRLQHPQLNSFTKPDLFTVSEIQKKLSHNEALIEYMLTDDKVIAFWITNNETSWHTIVIDSSSTSSEYIAEKISDFRAAIQEKAPLDILEKKSLPLYNILLELFINTYDGIEHLIIVPSKSLSVLPFDALYINNSFLVEDYNIKYLPSSSIYKSIKPPHRTTPKDLFAVAGSGFNNSSGSGNNFSSLPSALLEVDAISSEFSSVLALRNEDVTESKIKNTSLSEFRYLHFATHGKVNESNPEQSSLILSELNTDDGLFQEDGYLNSKEISSLKLNADLVVLSACNTAIGKLISGEGLQGLQRSFFKAGASSVVVSLWNVYDRSTASFMAEFYRGLNRFEDEEIGLWSKLKMSLNLYEPPMFGYKERALHQAKITMLEHPYYNHPVYWAPFIMLGK